MNFSILYRGPLSSCNYACDYCPFAKRTESRAELEHDRQCLERFLSWVESQTHRTVQVFFTPWGEALVRRWYTEAIVRLSNLPHVTRVAAQTNLSGKLDWLAESDRSRVALWCTYHPGEVSRSRFLAQVNRARAAGARLSVGVVGLHEHRDEVRALRRELPADVYLWVNAYKRVPDYYTPEMIDELTEVDPLFPINNQRHRSLGQSCRTGRSVISVDGDGTVRRCHFVRDPIGNLYADDFDDCLRERPCPNETCGCHIGYVHLDRLGMSDVFGDGLLERVPQRMALPILPSPGVNDANVSVQRFEVAQVLEH